MQKPKKLLNDTLALKANIEVSEKVKRIASERVEIIKKELKGNQKRIKQCEAAIELLKEYQKACTDPVVELINDTATRGLQEIFDESYEFILFKEDDKKRRSLRYMVRNSEYVKFIDINMTQGDLLKQIVAFLLRLIIVLMDRRFANCIILDEPFSGAEEANKPKIAEFIKKISEDFGIQIIMVTHGEVYLDYADNLIEL